MNAKSIVLMTALSAGVVHAGQLIWNGAENAVWNTTATNWKDTDGNASAWVDGSTAVFDDNGGHAIAVDGSVQLGGLVFSNTTVRTISGGTLVFAAKMPIDFVHDAGATISSAVTVTDGFVARQDYAHAWPDLLPCYGNDESKWECFKGREVTLWNNRTLTELDIRTANIFTHQMKPLAAKVYHPKWSGTKLTCQFQCDSNGEGIYCVYVEFVQNGDDITARVVRARCRATSPIDKTVAVKLGDDFDQWEAYGGGGQRILDGVLYTTTGLGIRDITAVSTNLAGSTLWLNGTWSPVGDCIATNFTIGIEGGQRY